jgi:hypothetical protein
MRLIYCAQEIWYKSLGGERAPFPDKEKERCPPKTQRKCQGELIRAFFIGVSEEIAVSFSELY